MNIYDFDKTIYRNDSTVDFFKYLLKKQPLALFKNIPWFIVGVIGYGLRLHSKTKMKEMYYHCFKYVNDIDLKVKDFWDLNQDKVYNWYIKQQDENDIIISASPTFLLEEISNRLKINNLLASKVDKNSGKYDGLNCYGEEKVVRLKEFIKEPIVDKFYSDSLSDTPLALLAKEAYIISDGIIKEWPGRKL